MAPEPSPDIPVNEAFEAALARHEAGRVDEAEASYQDILKTSPDHPESLHLLGLIRIQRGDHADGAALVQRAMILAPGRAPHHNSLALAWRGMGRQEDAVREYRRAAALRPGSPEILNNLAASLSAVGSHQEAIATWREAVAVAPSIAEIWSNLAKALAEHGDTGEAEAAFRRALAIRPDFAMALAGLGRLLTLLARWAEAEPTLSRAVRLAPQDARCWNNLAVARQELGLMDAAESGYRRALAIDPGFADAHYNLGCLLSLHGRVDAAVASHEAAIAADPAHGAARLAVCTARLPILCRDETEVAARRGDYRAALERLVAAVEMPEVAASVADAVGRSQPFFLPYLGSRDREEQAIYGQLVCRLLARPTRQLASRPGTGERIRVGIVSGYFQDHTIWRLFLEGWLTQLDRGRFMLIGFHTGPTRDAETARAATLCDEFVTGPLTFDAWRETIAATEPHVLLYPEVGMDPVAGRLAALRLAPVQCVAWGHPETTGMPTMDHFLTAELMEPPDGAAHYTEHLVRLPGLGVYVTPEAPPMPLDRAALGLDPDLPVFWSGQALYKYAPRYDAVFPRIARAVGDCRFVFIGFARSRGVTEVFRERMHRAFAAFGFDPERYVTMMEPMPQQRFLSAMGSADVVLDTPGWSGGRSTFDCLAVNPAIVTLPGPLMRSRHTAAILRRIGCTTTIAASVDEYVAMAVRLARDAGRRAAVRADVAQGKARAFRDTGSVRALEEFLLRVCSEDRMSSGFGDS
jgi:predicted O-linked N-acetylglucosamine transferase (SPINDLY family)